MTRSAAAAGVTNARDFGDSRKSAGLYLTFDGAFGNKKAGADQRFIACPIVACGVAVFANRGQQSIAGESRTVFVIRYYAEQRLGSNSAGLGRCFSCDLLG